MAVLLPSQAVLRSRAIELLRTHLPCIPGGRWYRDVVAQGRDHDRWHSSPADLAFWLLWSLGCDSSKLLNRDIPELGIKWDKGKGVGSLIAGAERLAAWIPFRLETAPLPGDIIIAGSRSRGDIPAASIFIDHESSSWLLAEEGPCGPKGEYGAWMSWHDLRGERLVCGRGSTTIIGWIDLSQLELPITE